jgi:hypothetical protein
MCRCVIVHVENWKVVADFPTPKQAQDALAEVEPALQAAYKILPVPHDNTKFRELSANDNFGSDRDGTKIHP